MEWRCVLCSSELKNISAKVMTEMRRRGWLVPTVTRSVKAYTGAGIKTAGNSLIPVYLHNQSITRSLGSNKIEPNFRTLTYSRFNQTLEKLKLTAARPR
jgi:hypothetical protein